jgi:hypothetical protein
VSAPYSRLELLMTIPPSPLTPLPPPPLSRHSCRCSLVPVLHRALASGPHVWGDLPPAPAKGSKGDGPTRRRGRRAEPAAEKVRAHLTYRNCSVIEADPASSPVGAYACRTLFKT